ncbi:MAG: helix-turn-helix domain-containing protein [Gemmatimonadaceae bacterium]
MTLAVQILARGSGWQASSIRCSAGPADTPYEEQHDRVCMAVVLGGTFGYRSSRGTAILAPGAILLGNPGDCFECAHQCSIGDRCLSFHFDPAFYEGIVAATAGATRLTLERPALSPDPRRSRLLVNADWALDAPGAIEELAHELAGSVATAFAGARAVGLRRGSHSRRIQDVVHWIERDANRPLPLAVLAEHACMSPYHFLREFKRVVGMSPHQFVLAQRVRRAAHTLRHSDALVAEVAADSGFADLSEFNRRFRRTLGLTPTAFRRRSAHR